ncbi:MAG TPA: ATP-binding protein [Methylomirabilota bacterium]|nr:ATP-binding protein [Methylomirabilota bacterium]
MEPAPGTAIKDLLSALEPTDQPRMWESTSPPTPSPAELRVALDVALGDSLRPTSIATSFLFAIFTVSHSIILPPTASAWMAPIAAVTSLASLGLYLILRQKVLAAHWFHLLGAVLAGVVLLNCLLPLALLSEPLQSTNLMIFLVGVGCLFLSTPWLLFIIAATWLGWFWASGGAAPSPVWRHFGFGLLFATALSLVVHIVRLRSLTRLALLHLHEKRRQQELEQLSGELELRVEERTRKLTAANTTLRREIADRRQAEISTKALLAVAEDISGTLDLQELLQRVQRRAAEILPCDLVGAFYWDADREVFRVISHHGLPNAMQADANALAFPMNEPFGGRLAAGNTIVINDVSEQPRLLKDLFARFQITTMIAAPLRVRGRHLGSLVACNTTSRHFDSDRIELFKGIAQQLAVALESVDLYKQQQEEAAVSAVLARVGQEMIASLNTPAIVATLCQLTAEALEGNCSCTFLWQPESNAYAPVAHWGLSPESQAFVSVLKLPPDMAAVLVRHLQTHETALERGSGYSDFLPHSLLQQCEIESAMFLRLRRGQELIGFQLCGYRQTKHVTDRHERIARGIAHIASLALTNARLLEELDRANRIKEDFMGAMSHELRTPLNVIVGYTQLMQEETFGPLTPEQVNILQRVNKNTRELLDLINATLDLSKLQNQQRISLLLQEVKGAVLLAELEQEIRQLHQKPAIRMAWRVAPHLPVLYTDAVKLKMVLKNLITNAIKFTDSGEITVSATQQREVVEFSVTDTGIGIPQDALPVIFEPFRQVDGSSTRRYGGVGLGLYIVRQLVALLGGKVTVESQVGLGSTFRVEIPLTPRERQEESTRADTSPL